MAINNRRDILLLLLYSPGQSEEINQPIAGRTKFVKMLFLFMKEALKAFKRGTEVTEENFYTFFPWYFGPFSSEIYDDLNFFELRGFIVNKTSDEETTPESAAEWALWLSSSSPDNEEEQYSEYQEEEFTLTPKGCKFVEKNLYPDLTRSQIKLLKEFRSRIEMVPLRAILKYVYEKYPSQTENSQIYEQVTG